MDEARTPELKMATDFVPSMCILWKAFGLSCGVGVVPIGAFHKKNFRCILVSSRSCTMLENEGKRCFTSSLNYWSNKTLESNMSQTCLLETPYTELAALQMRYTDFSGVVDCTVVWRSSVKGDYATEDQES